MNDTPHLNLPYIKAGQAQKHVTHNEAIRALDAIVQLSVIDRDLNVPPLSPADGDRYIIAQTASGDWVGNDLTIAAFQDGGWIYYPPQEGWLAWVADEDKLLAWDGVAWGEVSGAGGSVNPTPLVGINTTADTANRLSVKSDAVLFSHDDITPGSGNIQAKLNKASQSDTASFLFQNNFSGRAEFGLVGDDDFSLKTSADGLTFKQSMVASRGDASVRFPSGVSDLGIGSIGGFRNVIINGDGRVNQRGFAGGALDAGVYGFDRWRAGAGGCTLSNSGGQWSLNGPIEQMVEDPGLGGKTVTLSVEALSQDMPVSIGSQSGVIPAGPGRQSLTITLGGGDNGDLLVQLNPASTTVLANVQLEEGPVATPFERRPIGMEMLLCQRYYMRISSGQNGAMALAMAQTVNQYVAVLSLPITPRINPTISFSGTYRIYRYDGAFSNVSGIAFRTLDANILRLTVTTDTYPGASLAVFYPFSGSVLEIDAEF